MAFDPIYIHDMNCVSPLGLDLASNWTQLLAGNSSIVQHDVGRIKNIYTAKMGEELMDTLLTPTADSTLLERMLFTAAKPIVEKYKPTARTALVMSTTKGNVTVQLTVLRSEEHTSELQSRENLVCRLLHEKKKYNN